MGSTRLFGLVLGRFQPLHLGHMEYLEAAKARCQKLVIGITNPDISSLSFHQSDPKRSMVESNPFSYFFRLEMIENSLLESDWNPQDFAIVPADVADMDRLGAFLPPNTQTTVFITIYDEWGEEKVRRLRELQYDVEILWRRSMSDRLTSGTELRRRMRTNESWKHLVPPAVVKAMEDADKGHVEHQNISMKLDS